MADSLVDLRRRLLPALIQVHRWLGIAFSPLLVVWFASGIVIIYAQMPTLTNTERLARLPRLNLADIRLSPAAAAARARTQGSPGEVILSVVDNRPAYHFAGRSLSVFADDGTRFEGYSRPQAVHVARAWLSDPSLSRSSAAGYGARHLGMIAADSPDQWTVQGQYRVLAPIHKVGVDDGAGTVIYISDVSGQVVLRTTRSSRFAAWFGAIPHWIYVLPLRKHLDLWSSVIIYASLLATLAALAGLVVGLVRWSPTRRHRLPEGTRTGVPYRGWKRWHYLSGLVFGVTTVTWMFSGLLSMGPWGWSPSSSATGEQVRIVAGGALDLKRFDLPDPAMARCSTAPVAELELVQFRGRPYYFLLAANGSSILVEDGDEGSQCVDTLGVEALLAAATAAVPNAKPLATDLLQRHDVYYYSRAGDRPLPVLRVKFDDVERTWLYLDPRRGTIAARHTARSRLNRWLFQGFHSFDLPWLYERRPLWDLLVITFLLGGLAASLTGTVSGWQYLKELSRRGLGRVADRETT